VNTESFNTDRYKALLFDFDGTLLDSFSAHLDVFRIMFARFGITIEKQQFLNSYSPNWYKTYEGMGLPKKDWEAADQIWLQEVEHQEPQLYPGVSDTLRRLNEYCDIGLVTSGSKTRVVKDLERTGIISLFKVIVTGDDIQFPKPSPDGLEKALQTLDVQPEEAAYIGDANADYEMSRAGGVNFIGVRSAYDRFKHSDAFICMASINELPELLGIF